MTDYCTEASVLLPNDGSKKAKAMAKGFLELWYADLEKYEEDIDCMDDHTGFGSEWDTFSDCIWVHEGENANIENITKFIQKYLRFMNIDGGVWISWANTCSKPRVNEASGGEAVVTRNEVFWSNPGRLIDEVKVKGVEVLNT